MPFSLYTGDIVVSGISAKLPDSENMTVFQEKLLSGQDMVTSERPRWTPGFLGLPERNGRIMTLDKFDAQYFGVHSKQAQSMDPQMRMLLELTHEAIVDAGLNPVELRGSKTGVFIGMSGSDSETFLSAHPDFINGYVSPGHHRSMIANRISFTFDLKGPSFPVDTACSSSMIAMESAVNAIRLGKCNSAIVGGSNLVLHPYVSFHSHKLGMFSPDGKCKSFDVSGDGYVRSEGIAVILLQKKPAARREYLTIVNIRSNTDGYKANGLTFPSGQVQKILLEETYAEVGVEPSSIEYFEAHGTGTKAGDPQELNSVAEVFCSSRSTGNPLLIGSVKSNVGHLEPVAGLASVAKMIIAAQTGLIPGNLHYNIPNPEIPALTDGRFKVVTENTKWGRGLFGLNSFGWGGANVHSIFKAGAQFQVEDNQSVPLIVPFSGRISEAVQFAFDKLTTTSHQREVVALSHEIHKLNIPGHPYRGVSILREGVFEPPKIEEVPLGKNQQIFFIFSGMGSQAAIGPLMAIDPFRKSIEKSAAILSSLGYNLMAKLGSESFDTVTDSFVNIASTQVALVDTLRSIGIEPDGIIGHSVGEVACGYADGCLSHEETIELAYWRGISLIAAQKECAVGSMAAVGQSWAALEGHCPADIFPACHNTKDSVTLSGPEESIRAFVGKLQADGVFAREVPTNGFAFHSTYVSAAGKELKTILSNGRLPGLSESPKRRSAKWISTSVSDTEAEVGKTCSVDYHVNNLLSPVNFATALDRIPEDSIVLELAPHALLQALLRRGISVNCKRIGLTRKDAQDQLTYFLEALGSIYLQGISLNFSKLYKEVSFPVSVDTPMLAPLIQWDHSVSWDVGSFKKPHRMTGEGIVDISLSSEDYSFLADHVIDGRNICPVTMYLYATWRTFAALNESSPEKFPVVFESVQFHRPILLSKESNLRLFVQVLNNSGHFEIEESNSLLASGKISKLDTKIQDFPVEQFATSFGTEQMSPNDIYKELKLRGYEYKTRFRGIQSHSMGGGAAKIKWTNHWVSFLDSLLQSLILPSPSRDLDLPASIDRVVIDPLLVQQLFDTDLAIQDEGLPALVNMETSSIYCPGIQLEGMGTKRATRKPLSQRAPMLNDAVFIPYDNKEVVSPINGTTALIDIVLDNSDKLMLEYLEFTNNPNEALVNNFREIDSFRTEYMVRKTVYKSNTWHGDSWYETRTEEGVMIKETESADFLEEMKEISAVGNVDIVVIHTVELLPFAQRLILNKGFLIVVSTTECKATLLEVNDLKLASVQKFNGKFVYLLRKLAHNESAVSEILIPVTTLTYEWFEVLKDAMIKAAIDPGLKILLTAQPQEFEAGIVGLVKCLRKEPGGTAVRYISSQHRQFDVRKSEDDNFLKKILLLDLVHNAIDSDGTHGFFLHRELTPLKPIATENCYLDMLVEGDPQSFNWIQASPYTETKNNKTVRTYFASLNLAELTEASHQISQGVLKNENRKFAIEFSGIDGNGRRLIGIADSSALGTTMEIGTGGFSIELPSNITLEDGVTLPLSYFTAIYALIFRGNLKEGETLLVTNGNTPLGQAAIYLANALKCHILVSAASDKEREFLKTTFPFITDQSLLSISTADPFLATKLSGADIILNLEAPVALKKLPITLKNNGRFLDFTADAELPRAGNNISVHKIVPADLLVQNHPLTSLVSLKFAEFLVAGYIKPLPAIYYDKENVQEALRGISKESAAQKVIVRLREDNNNMADRQTPAFPRTYFDPSKAYILIGGLGETGIEIVSWMISRGAKKLILCNRSGVTNSYQRYHCTNWKRIGAQVLCPKTDVTDYESLRDAFKLASGQLQVPIAGIFNLSMVLRDSFIESMSLGDFEAAVNPKVFGTINLDRASREFCGSDLKYFCVFSSVTSARGNAGQTNYGFGNSMAERLIEKRIRDGLPGLALQFGPIGDVGYVETEMGGSSEDKVIASAHPQRIRSVLNALDILLQNPVGIKSSVVMAQKRKNGGEVGKANLLESLASILGFADTNKMDLNYNLGQLGMDSLMTVEIKQMMEQGFGIFIPIQELRTSTVAQLLAKETK